VDYVKPKVVSHRTGVTNKFTHNFRFQL